MIKPKKIFNGDYDGSVIFQEFNGKSGFTQLPKKISLENLPWYFDISTMSPRTPQWVSFSIAIFIQ